MLGKDGFSVHVMNFNGDEVVFGVGSALLACSALLDSGESLSDAVGYASE